MQRVHKPVMVAEVWIVLFSHCKVVSFLKQAILPETGSPLFVDGCAGLGGHSAALLDAFPTSRLLCIDRDPSVLSMQSCYSR